MMTLSTMLYYCLHFPNPGWPNVMILSLQFLNGTRLSLDASERIDKGPFPKISTEIS